MMNFTFALSFLIDDCLAFSYDVGVAELDISYVKTLVLRSTLIFSTGAKLESRSTSRKKTKIAFFLNLLLTFLLARVQDLAYYISKRSY